MITMTTIIITTALHLSFYPSISWCHFLRFELGVAFLQTLVDEWKNLHRKSCWLTNNYHQNLEPMKTQVPKKNLGFQEKPRFLLFMVFTSFNKFDEFHELEWIRSLWSSNFLDTHQIRPLTNPSGSLMFFSFSPLIIPWWIQIHASSYEQPSVSAAKF